MTQEVARMPGPAPNPNARRNSIRGDWIELPASCELEPPPWPFAVPDADDTATCPTCGAADRDLCRTPGGRKAKSPHRARIIATVNREAQLPSTVLARWRQLWTLPQAHIWHEQRAVRIVARLVLVLDIAESPGGTLDPRYSAEARQLEDRLLLSPDRLIRARYVITEPAAEATGQGGTVTDLDEYRELYG